MKVEKPIEYRSYTDNETGKVFEVPVINHTKKNNVDFEMVFYGHFLDILNDLGNKKIKILQYIIKNKSKSENVFIGTVREIASALDSSLKTVNDTLILLEDKGAIKRKTGVIYIDANLICDGRFKDRIMHVYHNIEDLTIDEQESRLNREIERKKRELEQLERMRELRKKPEFKIVRTEETEPVTEEEAAELEAEFYK